MLGIRVVPFPPGVRVPKVRQRPALFLILALCVMGAHVALNAHFPSHSESISYCFFLPVSVLAAEMVLWRAVRSAPGLRLSWWMFGSALTLWAVATFMAARAHIFVHASPNAANIDDFLYFFYAVPILLAIAIPDESRQGTLFFWFDGIQAAAVGFLAYLALFNTIPFSGIPQHPMPVSRLIWIYDAENVILAGFATARMLVSPRNAAYRRFFKMMVIYLWVYATCASVYNHIVSAIYDAGMLDVLVDVPFLLLAGIIAFTNVAQTAGEGGNPRRPAALFIDNARPVLLGLALVTLGASVAREYFSIAMGTILGAFVLYGIRSAMLQSRLLNTQMLLEEANTRLAEMTLEDGLTGIANRRCFDQRLAHEWGRAHRTRTPLSLLLIDIDHFKKLNDTHGHLVGDECLIQVARTLRGVLQRPGDLFARYGGEEFVALLPETDESGARNVAERLQGALRGSEPIAGLERQVTISIGGTTWINQKHVGTQKLVDLADRALYEAKQNGRNRIEYLSANGERDQLIARD